ncbi:MAG TPA: ABC transporter ATP-binding protein, partial [Chloroflexota bacterium]|nr:ABC transporter ATP-binding protein [Chloroflexota bacterium]
FIDGAQAAAPLRTLLTAAVLYLAVALLSQVSSVAETYMAEQVGWIATNRLRADLTLHCLTLDMTFHKAHSPGELIERVDGDISALANFFSRFVIAVLGNLLLLLGVLVLLVSIDWRIGLALALLTALGFAAANGLRGLAVPQWAAARQASAELYGFLEERLGGTEDLRANGATVHAMRQLAVRLRAVLQHQRRASVIGGSAWSTLNLVFAAGIAAAFVLGAARYQAGALSIGAVYLVLYYTQMLQRPLEEINRQMQDFQRAAAGITRILALFAEQPTLLDGPGVVFPAGPLAVDVDEVTFRYDEGEPVLHDFSFHLAAGHVLAVLGRTGSGKTSLSRLLTRLYDPDAGSVRVGGGDLRRATLSQIHRHIGMVTQDVQIFRASVRDNLTFFDPAIDDERLRDALHDVGLWGWYEALPQGLASVLTADGLSAGEAQLLALARAFLAEPGLVILDEASSRLDPATEARIERAVDRLLRRRTAIIIAHRLDTVRRADEIMVLEDGRVVEHGARRRLLADPGSRFARLLQEQSAANEPAMTAIEEG